MLRARDYSQFSGSTAQRHRSKASWFAYWQQNLSIQSWTVWGGVLLATSQQGPQAPNRIWRSNVPTLPSPSRSAGQGSGGSGQIGTVTYFLDTAAGWYDHCLAYVFGARAARLTAQAPLRTRPPVGQQCQQDDDADPGAPGPSPSESGGPSGVGASHPQCASKVSRSKMSTSPSMSRSARQLVPGSPHAARTPSRSRMPTTPSALRSAKITSSTGLN